MIDPTLLLSLGGGMIAGMAVGIALKTAIRWALLVLGLLILGVWGLVHLGIVTVDWGALSQSIETSAEAASGWIQFAVADLSAQLAGFSAGLFLGFKFR